MARKAAASFLERLRSDRVYRQRLASRIARKSGVDPGDVEHSLFSLTLEPTQRLARCLARRKTRHLPLGVWE